MNGTEMSKSDLLTILSTVAVGIVILFLSGWLSKVTEESERENKNETIQDSEKKDSHGKL